MGSVGEHAQRLLGQLPVGSEIVRATEEEVVHPGHRRSFDVDLVWGPDGALKHRVLFSAFGRRRIHPYTG
jgi:hypothetical protein